MCIRDRIPTDCIDWSVYDKNPVLLYNRASEGHKAEVANTRYNDPFLQRVLELTYAQKKRLYEK